MLSLGEGCEPPGVGACNDACQLASTCGNGLQELPEECDDNNLQSGDGCDQDCLIEQIISEQEPNDDGLPSQSGTCADLNGNDFSAQSAQGPFNSNTVISGALTSGDEDVFAVTNTSNTTQNLTARTFLQASGIGVACDVFQGDTVINVRDAQGALLSQNDSGGAGFGSCAALTLPLVPGQTVFVQVLSRGDCNGLSGYLLLLNFSRCGNGVLESAGGEECEPGGAAPCDSSCQRVSVCGDGFIDAPETCDDSNATSGDGCSASCQSEVCPAGQTQLIVAASGLPLAIPDNNPVGITSTINISATGVVTKAFVIIGEITHSFDGDLTLTLKGPNNVTRSLSVENGDNGDNYLNTLFSDGCPPITAGAAPFTGCFSPQQSLSSFNNISASGAWVLKASDSVNQDTGSINEWSLGLCLQ